MPDQPEHIANATLGYDYKGFSARFSVLYQSDVSTFINSRNPIFDSFSGDYLRFDIALQQDITEGLEAFANFNNINGRPDRNYLGGPENRDRPTYTEFYGFTMDIGVRYEF
jgi:outer membrane receptor protein involved in Fe transport